MKLTGVAAAGPAGLLVALISIAAPAPAHAGGAVKAHLECTPAGGKPLKATQKAVLDHDVTCAIVVDGGAVAAGATVAVTSSVTTPAGPVFRQAHPGTASADGKRYDAPLFKAGTDFVGCAPVVFEGAIVADQKPLWSSTVTITPPCAAPKPTTARLVCTADTDQGILKFPGNGDAVKADLSSGLTCTVSWKPDAGGDTPKWGALNVHGSGKPAELRPLAAAPGATTMIAFAQFIQPVVPACKPFVVDAVLLRSDGAPVATLKQAIVQACAKK